MYKQKWVSSKGKSLDIDVRNEVVSAYCFCCQVYYERGLNLEEQHKAEKFRNSLYK